MLVSIASTKQAVQTRRTVQLGFTLACLALVVLFVLSASMPLAVAAEHSQHAHSKHVEQPNNNSSTARYQVREIANPLTAAFTKEIELLESDGNAINLHQLLDSENHGITKKEIHIIQFIFTSCKNICPVMSTIVQAIQRDVEGEANLISISIDPQHDRPEHLTKYARLFGALDHWRFFTGELSSITNLQKRLNVFQQNKMQHQPVTFVIKANRLFRIDGLPSRVAMLAELQHIQQM